MKTAVISGATGLVGSALLKQLLDDDRYAAVIALTRRDLGVTHSKLTAVIADFHHPDNALTAYSPDDVFCCLGTTMAKAGSKKKFYEVDFEFPLALAKATHALGAKQFLLVSALGASKTSAVYYNRVKGEVEQAVIDVGFEGLHIFRPSLLLGDRKEKRAGEDAAKFIFNNLGFLVPVKYKAVEGSAVAAYMLECAAKSDAGVHIHESREIWNYQRLRSHQA